MPWDLILDAISDFLDASSADEEASVASEVGSKNFYKYLAKYFGKQKTQAFYEMFKDIFRRRMNHFRNSRGNPYNTTKSNWFESTSKHDIRAIGLNALKEYMMKDLHMPIRDVQQIMNTMRKQPLKHKQPPKKKKEEPWYYLTANEHSDKVIEKIRRQRIGKKRLKSNMELVFVKGKGTIYTYYNVPMIVFTQMTLIGLGETLPSGYRAGAWHFFYTSVYKDNLVPHGEPILQKLEHAKNTVQKTVKVFTKLNNLFKGKK